MSLVVTPGYTWVNGEVETATKLNLAATPTIADGQAGVFSTITASNTIDAVSTVSSHTYVIGNSAIGTGGFQLGRRDTGAISWTLYSASGDFTFSKVGTGDIVTVSSTGLAVTGAISATTDLSVGGIITYSGGLKIVPSDFVASSSTLTNVTGLLVNVLNGGIYRFSIVSALSQAGGGGYKVGLGGTATMSAGASVYQYLTSTVANSIQGNLGIGGFSSAAINASQAAAFMWHGTFTASSTGTVTVQFAQNSSTSSSTFPAGSYFEVVRIS